MHGFLRAPTLECRYSETRYSHHEPPTSRPMNGDPLTHLPLSQAEFQILLSVSAEPRHGYAIMQEVEDRCGPLAMLGPGTLYGAVKRLRRAGMIEEVDTGGSSRRRPYRITELGRRVAQAEAERHKALVRWADAAGL